MLRSAAARFLAKPSPIILLLGGLVLAHHPMFADHFGAIQTDLGDARLNNYLVENSYQWLISFGHHSLWNPPFYFPAQNVGAYTDLPFGAAPLYWIWRLASARADTAYQLWLVSLSAANFLAAYFLCRRRFNIAPLPGSLGAYLFAFGLPRIHQVGHTQFLAHFFTVGALAAILGLCRERGRSLRNVALLAGCIVLQLYSGFYLGWLLLFALAIALTIALIVDPWRITLIAIVKKNLAPIFVASIVSALALWPMFVHYRMTLHEVGGYRGFDELQRGVPRLRDWLLTSRWSWVYLPINRHSVLGGDPLVQWMSIGIFSTVLAIAGLFMARRTNTIRAILLVSAALFVCTTSFFDWSPWSLVVATIPGAAAIRVAGSSCLLLLLTASIGIAFFFEWLTANKNSWLVALLALGMIVEQMQTTPAYSKRQNRIELAALEHRIGPTCQAFFFAPLEPEAPEWKYQIDGMWASLETGVPTLNGFSGWSPSGWLFFQFPDDESQFRTMLSAWLDARAEGLGIDPGHVCYIEEKLDRNLQKDNDADCGSVIAPQQLHVGEMSRASITLRNRGTRTWRTAEGYRLGSRAPLDVPVWGHSRIELPHDVAPGEEVHFDFAITAPSPPGLYRFRWQMLREYVEWFGCTTPPKSIAVIAK